MTDSKDKLCSNTTRKRRPPVQLYIPPAQRKNHIDVSKKLIKPCNEVNVKDDKKNKLGVRKVHVEEKGSQSRSCKFFLEDVRYFLELLPYKNVENDSSLFCHNCNMLKFINYRKIFPLLTVPVFHSRRRTKNLFILDTKSISWKSTISNNAHFSTYNSFKWQTVMSNYIDVVQCNEYHSVCNHNQDIKQCQYSEFCECNYGRIFIGNNFNCCNLPQYLQEMLCFNNEPFYDIEVYRYLCSNFIEASFISQINLPCAKVKAKHKTKQKCDSVIVLRDPIELPANNSNVEKKNCDHEQEKEIMRKAQKNINRKTRSIIKYVDSHNDTLRIHTDDNINDWEELFDDDGHLQEEILTEKVLKLGVDDSTVLMENNCVDIPKPSEELEHLVEVYDFPPSFETQDIIAAFSDLKCDAMYVKWIDDTHALLVLGSLTQAQKAVELSNSLIKARPMALASPVALAKAAQSDLKPAMKRPQTNLQTARRLITAHLGKKSKVSKEQNEKEREDLRVAREMKKMVRQNEKDAWEGSLRSALH